jgi:hypothetical protein
MIATRWSGDFILVTPKEEWGLGLPREPLLLYAGFDALRGL